MYHDAKYYEKFNLEELTKERLLTEEGLAIGLAYHNKPFGLSIFAQDDDVLEYDEGMVALNLACNSPYNEWGGTEAAKRLKILKLRNGEVAYTLACNLDVNGWDDESVINNSAVRGLCSGEVGKLIDDVLKEKREEQAEFTAC